LKRVVYPQRYEFYLSLSCFLIDEILKEVKSNDSGTSSDVLKKLGKKVQKCSIAREVGFLYSKGRARKG